MITCLKDGLKIKRLADFVYDNRKNVMNVREGLFAELAFLNYSASLGSTNTFRSTQLDVRYFRKGFHDSSTFDLLHGQKHPGASGIHHRQPHRRKRR